jgi:hypothetical protein
VGVYRGKREMWGWCGSPAPTGEARAEGGQVMRFVDKILKATKPGDLPVEQPRKFDIVVIFQNHSPS